MTNAVKSIPDIIAGPMLRHVSSNTLTIWLVSKRSLNPQRYASKNARNNAQNNAISDCLRVKLLDASSSPIEIENESIDIVEFAVGEHCFISTIIVSQHDLLTPNNSYFYDIELFTDSKTPLALSEHLSKLRYKEQKYFSFKYAQQLSQVLHGSCRKAHFQGTDALPQLDEVIAGSIEQGQIEQRPDLILLTGDQVYVDDVAGPMLSAIQSVIKLLGLYDEYFDGSTINCSSELLAHPDCFYRREQLLPKTKANEDLFQSFFKGKEKPVFTSVNARNHLISFNEMIALYLLSWSSRLWPHVNLSQESLATEYQAQYENERKAIVKFADGLEKVERAFAHIPIYMIFDDHDVTDDWNLTRGWEEQAYSNPFSKRIIGNALAAYFVCQGMGNPKSTWQSLLSDANKTFGSMASLDDKNRLQHGEFIDRLFEHNQWQYKLDTSPPIQVLDTRTQRWRSESNKNKPSGLMDWEGLCDLQQDIIGKESVILVSAAPIYGVKFIEAIQRVFTAFGGALMVDAENWMAHRGTASVMLNIFRHIKTPPNFIILSGDVHYSFVYDVSLRFRRNSPHIIQFTCSGIHNQFPDKLITWFERLNRWFYGHRSPLNWLTKRRNMSIKEREAFAVNSNNASKSVGRSHAPRVKNGSKHGNENGNEHDKDQCSTPHIEQGKDIVNATSIGLLALDDKGQEKACKLILANGDIVEFKR